MRDRRRLELKAARVRKGWTQLHLAIAVGVTQQTIAKWETGQSCPKSFAQMRRVGDALGVPINAIFADILEGVVLGE